MVSVQFTFDLPLFPESRQNPKIAAKHSELNQLEAEREASYVNTPSNWRTIWPNTSV